MLMNDAQLAKDYVYITTEDELCLEIAEEFIDRDQLKVYKQSSPLSRLTLWQILMIFATMILSYDTFVLGADMYPEG